MTTTPLRKRAVRFTRNGKVHQIASTLAEALGEPEDRSDLFTICGEWVGGAGIISGDDVTITCRSCNPPPRIVRNY